MLRIERRTRATLTYTLRRCDSGAIPRPLTMISTSSGHIVASSSVSNTTAAESTLTAVQLDPEAELAYRADHFYQALRSALSTADFKPSGGAIGFACVHLYEDRELPPVDTFLPTTTTASSPALKGADALVCVAASRLGLKVSLRMSFEHDCVFVMHFEYM